MGREAEKSDERGNVHCMREESIVNSEGGG